MTILQLEKIKNHFNNDPIVSTFFSSQILLVVESQRETLQKNCQKNFLPKNIVYSFTNAIHIINCPVLKYWVFNQSIQAVDGAKLIY